MREATERVDVLLGEIELGGRALLIATLTYAVDLAVLLGTVEVTPLPGASNGVPNASRMPRANAGDLSQTTMSLTRQTGDTPTGDDALETVTLGDGDDVADLGRAEDGVDADGALEEALSVRDLVGDGAAVDLNFHHVRLLLGDLDLVHLGVDEQADDGAVLDDLGHLLVDVLALPVAFRVLLGVLGEGLLLALVPVLVEATLQLVVQMLGPNRGQRAQTVRSLHVADETDGNNGRRLNNCNSLHDLLLMDLGPGLVDIADNVRHAYVKRQKQNRRSQRTEAQGARGHRTAIASQDLPKRGANIGLTRLVAAESGEMARVGRIVLGEGLHLPAIPGGAFLGKEGQRAIARCFELPVRHGGAGRFGSR